MKMTWKSEAAAVAGVLIPLLTIFSDKLPQDSEWVALVGVALTVCTYIAGWNAKQVGAARNAAMLEAVKQNPQQPQP